MPAGRFAPSPSGALHLGNLRTAVVAWLCAVTTSRDFVMRFDDLDRVKVGAADQQLADLAELGLTWTEPVVYQSARRERYQQVIDQLVAQGRTFECFCTRREIQQAVTAPHQPPGAYPGTCRNLSMRERASRGRQRSAAIRLRSEVPSWTIYDKRHGAWTGDVDDVVLQRSDTVPAYNLTVVVDDYDAGVDQVVRGDDLLASTPRQAYLADVLGLSSPEYVHVPLVLNSSGVRLAKRDGAVTLAELTALGVDVLALIAESLNLVGSTLGELATTFDVSALSMHPWVFSGVQPRR